MPQRAKSAKRSWKSRLKQSWNQFQAQPSGRRFQTYYSKEHRTGGIKPRIVLQVALGVLLLIVGGILCVIPGPGIPVLVAGAVLIARHVRPAAKFLDWVDVHVRRAWRAVKREWKQSSVALRCLMIVGVCAGAGTVAYSLVRVFF